METYIAESFARPRKRFLVDEKTMGTAYQYALENIFLNEGFNIRYPTWSELNRDAEE